MNRKKKYRVWYPNIEKMVHFEEPFVGLDANGSPRMMLKPKEGHVYMEDCELMEYTDRKDSNGIEIYEGDIIKTPLDHICVIEWGHVEIEIPNRGDDNDLFEYVGFVAEHKGCNYHFDRTIWNGEIIGNVYQNPELLEQAES